ncbi:unnamed protein product [marine sediment metagenome]|uniref:Uncharacterized protein n=1 Tax=marine sediment metagenome TaxID=412755 RepID=X1VVY3_9ZZZZ
MVLSKYSMDTFIAPRLSELTKVIVPDLHSCTKEYGNWVNIFILNTIVRVRIIKRDRQLIMYFLRKVEGAFQEYHEGRFFLESYVKSRNKAISSYFHSLRHFEAAMSLAYHAFDTIRIMNQGKKLFTKEDGSPLQRLNYLQNLSKHPDKGLSQSDISSELNISIWLTNEGIECHITKLLFSEFSSLLIKLAKSAEVISNPPLSSQKKNIT